MPRITYGTLLCIDLFVCNFCIQGNWISLMKKENKILVLGLRRIWKDLLELNKYAILAMIWKPNQVFQPVEPWNSTVYCLVILAVRSQFRPSLSSLKLLNQDFSNVLKTEPEGSTSWILKQHRLFFGYLSGSITVSSRFE